MSNLICVPRQTLSDPFNVCEYMTMNISYDDTLTSLTNCDRAAVASQTGALLVAIGALLHSQPDINTGIPTHTADLLIRIGKKLNANSTEYAC